MESLLNQSVKRAIVIAPHADDEVLGAGGVIALAVEAGWEVRVLYATISGYRETQGGSQIPTEAREDEVRRATEVLGVQSWASLFEGEALHLRLDQVPQIELISFIESEVNRFRPSLVVTAGHGHYHQDHRAVADATVAALRPAPGGERHFVPSVLAYGHSAAGWGGARFAFQPSVFADITNVLETKLESLACYESQLYDPPHPRSLEAVRDFHSSWGAYAGVKYAEPFECLRLVIPPLSRG